jgi:hypothetical protein
MIDLEFARLAPTPDRAAVVAAGRGTARESRMIRAAYPESEKLDCFIAEVPR